MLVLTRKPSQSIIIGDQIEVCVLEVSGGKVRLGIDAPRSVAVFRKEVHVAKAAHADESTGSLGISERADGS